MRKIHRLHEELHKIERDQSAIYLKYILKVFNFDRELSLTFLDMIEYGLGCCFDYFFTKLDSSRKAYLNYQHRMPEEIAYFLNKNIYSGRFRSSKSAINHGFEINLPNENFSKPNILRTSFISTSFCPNRNEVKIKKTHIKNELESKIALILLNIICNNFPLKTISNNLTLDSFTEENPFRIGIVTFYAYQSKTIRNNVRKLYFFEEKN